MKSLILPIFLLLLIIGCKRNKLENATASEGTSSSQSGLPPVPSQPPILDVAYMDSARVDLKKGKLKYYYHSIALPNAKFLKMFQDSLHITIAGIDRPNNQETSYNLITDSIVNAKTGKSILDWLKESK